MTDRAEVPYAARLDAAAPAGWRFGPRSFRTKIVASTVLLMAAAMVVVGFFIQVLLDRTSQRDVDRVLHERSSAMVAVVDQSASAQLTVIPETLEPGVVVFDDGGNPLAGSVDPDARDAAAALGSTAVERTTTTADGRIRMLAVPVTTVGGAEGVVVVSEPVAAYERSERYALIATTVLGVLVVAASALIALRVTQQALQPVTQMARRAGEWSEHDLDRRFDLGPPTNELAALGGILDQLLDRVASVILAEQRLTAELAHELRTPLTAIKGTAELALLRGVDDPVARRDLEQIAESASAMAGVITALLDISRDGSVGTTSQTCLAAEVLADVITALGASARDGVSVSLDASASTARITAPRELVTRAVLPVAVNALRHARTHVDLRAIDRRDRVDLLVVDDGSGIDPVLGGRVFEPGATTRPDGAGLGLGISRRVAASLGGQVDVVPTDPDGLTTFVVSLPRRA